MTATLPDFLVNADRRVTASLAMRRSEFDREAAGVDGATAMAGAFSSSAHRQIKLQLCAKELHGRTEMLVAAALESHKALGAAASNALLVAAKDWLDRKLAAEALQLAPRLVQPKAAFGENCTSDTLSEDMKREEDSAHARLDAEWARLERERMERALRWLVRISRALATPECA